LVPEGEDTKQPRLSLPTRFPATFPYKLHIAFHFLLYCSSSHTFFSGPPESVEEEKWQVQDEGFDIEKEEDNSSELPLQKAQACI
jgi:hypothetical protein